MTRRRVDPTEAPEGMYAVAGTGCRGCVYSVGSRCTQAGLPDHRVTACVGERRDDHRDVVFKKLSIKIIKEIRMDLNKLASELQKRRNDLYEGEQKLAGVRKESAIKTKPEATHYYRTRAGAIAICLTTLDTGNTACLVLRREATGNIGYLYVRYSPDCGLCNDDNIDLQHNLDLTVALGALDIH